MSCRNVVFRHREMYFESDIPEIHILPGKGTKGSKHKTHYTIRNQGRRTTFQISVEYQVEPKGQCHVFDKLDRRRTDMSPISAYAESRAALLARELGIDSLDLLHVIDTLSLKTLGQLVQAHEQAEHKLLDSCRRQLAEIETRLKDEHEVSVTTTALNVGRTHTDIVDYAKLLNAGLLVMGVHSGGVIRDLFIGSTVDKVVRMAPAQCWLSNNSRRSPTSGYWWEWISRNPPCGAWRLP